MNTKSNGITRSVIALLCVVLLLPGNTLLMAMQGQSPASQDARLSNEQLDSLVAPIALYPDPLLSQTLVACTYPLEIVQLQQFIESNKNLKDRALTDAVMKQDWDPSVEAMAAFPDLVNQLAQNIRWMDDLGNAFLAQQNDVMDAVQRMRAKAVDKGALKTTKEQSVETKVVENKTVVVVEPSSPDVVYVPSYDPMAVWGAPYYPYPPMAYPSYPTGGFLLGFGTGIAIGAIWGNSGWGWHCGWGGNNNININRNNTFINNYNNQRVNAGNRYGGNNNTWQHNPQHRGGAPYGNRDVANRYGGTSRGQDLSQRQNAARQGLGTRQQPAMSSGFKGPSGGTPSVNRGSFGSGGGGDRIGNRQVSNGSMGSRNASAFSGAGSSRSSAGASSSRGASSFGGRSAGGSRGGFSRGGGGRRR